MAYTVADQFVEVLVAAGVKRVYGVVGDSLNGLPMRCGATARSNGFTCAMKKRGPSQQAPKRT